jgi:flagellar biosynthetic protein FliP
MGYRRLSSTCLRRVWLVALFGLAAVSAFGQDVAIPSIKVGLETARGSDDVSTSLQLLALLTVLSVAPGILILTTAFTRIVIIFSFVRNALGATTIPPNQVLIGLSLFLTFYVMAPTWDSLYKDALSPYLNKKLTFEQAFERAQKPVRAFMLKNTYKKDLKLFLDLRKEQPTSADEVSLLALIPAFVVSELKTAFIIGFYVFVPFLVIDMIVAGSLMSMGMMMLPPTVVSLPAKLLVFVLADGWSVLVQAIMSGYR